jgi:electron transfer flavoprotein alpha subunit
LKLYIRYSGSNLSTLAILEHKNKTFLPASLSALTAASKLGSGDVTALLTGSDAKSLSSQASKLSGVTKILLVPNEAYDHFLPENFATLIAEAAKNGGFTHVIAAHGQFGKNTIPRVGALLDVQPIADIIEVQNEDTFVRQIYAGNFASKGEDN